MRGMIIAMALVVATPLGYADSLFSAAVAERGTLISEKKKRFEPGDIITIQVRESLDAQTRADTETRQDSEIESQAREASNQFLVAQRPEGFGIMNPEQLPNWNIDVDNEHRARGTTRRTNVLETTITSVVKEVHENGNIFVEGQKTVEVNREDTKLSVRGLVRPSDIGPDNTVDSTRVANVELKLEGQGPLWNNQRRGLLTRFLDWFSLF